MSVNDERAVATTGSQEALPAATPSTGQMPVPLMSKARRGIALLAVVVTVGGFFGARASGELDSCQTKVTRTSGSPAKVERVTECEPLPVETVAPALLLVLALMWPDLTSFELFGLGKVTRRLNDQDARQNELEAAQMRLENRVSVDVANSPTFNNFPNNPVQALDAERMVDEAQRRISEQLEGGEKQPEPADLFEELRVGSEPLKTWLNIARRLNDPIFSQAVEAGAASGSPADDPRLIPADAELLRRVQRPGQPFDLAGLRQWAAENALQIDAVRDTLSAGPSANSQSVRVATKFAGQLLSDLQRRGLVAT
jgi:hypothetical protein